MMDRPPNAADSAVTPAFDAVGVAWSSLKQFTPARIALGRAGISLPTREVLGFKLAHAQARDAIHLPLDTHALVSQLCADGWPAPRVLHSKARDRHEYLLRPDLGRRLDEASLASLADWRESATKPVLALVIGDGLSALGIQLHVVALMSAIRDVLGDACSLSPPVVVKQARVAVADEVGQVLGAEMVAMMVGERPGLSSPDSVGIYLTHSPVVGRTDAERNCISNVRPAGLDVRSAARKLAWLVQESRRLGLTGVGLKDQSASAVESSARLPDHPPCEGLASSLT